MYEIPSKVQQPKDIFQDSVVDLRHDVPRPPLAISFGDYNDYGTPQEYFFGTFGNISLIKGEEKVRKSFAKSLILACATGGKANNYSERIKGHSLKDKWIVDIDTEQDPYYVKMNTNRIIDMVGHIPPNYLALQLRKHTPEQRLAVLEYLFEKSPIKDKLGIVFIDGYVDLLKDFNSNIESNELTHRLMKWSAISNSHISGILHLNPGTQKGRGHLGTILQQKCETIAIVTKDEERSTISCQRARGINFPPLTFEIDRYKPKDIEISNGDTSF